ncbi:DNA polymerase I [Candidatus Persebacteraceae bacterium Df01]|jgi:DNA polymerase-1|uniref:DNA polymerase I n=1 Tax=Candidatus Doriopsillibacter californiensis TaxID=2970740 RepID=A0ABT7QK87_9GAMM|nr:DNA polymerase I [Candidatus Persebacteraceae bacterium Df01]
MRLLIVDATGYLFRAFHAMGDFRTKEGVPTGAIYGLVNMLDKLQRDWPAQRVACVMDAAGKTFRHKMSSDYKANRPPLNPDLRTQIEPSKHFIAALGWPLLCETGVEADDVIATLVLQGQAAGMEVVIASADKDLMQLVNEKVSLFDGFKDKSYDSDGVREKFGVLPEQMADYLALTGDSSDNIRGVTKVGAKTAAKWLNIYSSLDNLISHADEIKGVVGDNLRTAITDGTLDLARRLVTLKTDVPLPSRADSLSPRPPDATRWRELCTQYEFRHFAALTETTTLSARAVVKTITTITELQAWVDAARRNRAVALDTETDGSPVMQATLVGFSLALDDNRAAYVPLAHRVELGSDSTQLAIKTTLAILKPLLEDKNTVKIFHNAKYDLHVLANYNLQVCGVVEDTKVAAYVLSPDKATNMDALAAHYLDIKTVSYRDVVDGKTLKHFSQTDIETASRYAAEDAEVTWKLRKPIIDGLTGNQADVYKNIDRPLIGVLMEVERAGVRLDEAALNNFANAMRARMKELETEAHRAAGEPFNLNSPRQLETLLFDKLKALPLRKTTGGKARSTNQVTLEKLAADYPLARIVLEYRGLAKLTGTYAEKLPRMINPNTKRVHTDFNQTWVITGRVSSSTPNLQNIPIRTAEGRRIRQAFVASPGALIISADYSQIELRIMAHIANDAALIDAFAADADIHRRTAAEIFGIAENAVSGEQRRAAKAINFGLIYGMSAFGLSRSIDATREQAQHYIDRYFSRYPQVAKFMAQTRACAMEQGFVETLFGRRIPTLAGVDRQAAERAAINAPMQGSAADIIKLAMLATHQWLHGNNMQTRIILQVHDELVLEAPKTEVDEVLEKLPSIMCGVVELRVPLKVSISAGKNWDIAH